MKGSSRVKVLVLMGGAAMVMGGGIPGPILYRGMPHLEVGGATASLSPDGNLVVSNIGSSGKDGVSIDPGVGEGMLVECDFGPAGALPPGANCQLEMIVPPPPSEGQDQKAVCVIFNESQGGQAQVAIDPQFYNPIEFRVEALRNGLVLDTVIHPPPYPFPMPILQGEVGSHPTSGGTLTVSNIGSSGKDGLTSQLLPYAVIDLGAQSTIQLAGSPLVVSADQIMIEMDLPGGTLAPIDRVEVRAANIPQFVLIDEALGMFGNRHRALGTAQMNAGGDHLIVSNIGSSGKDGVSIDVGETLELFETFIAPPLRGPDTQFTYDAIGRLTSGSDIMLRTTYAYDALDRLFFTPDFSPVGAQTSGVRLSLGGVPVGETSGLVGPVAETDDNPECIIWDIKGSCAEAGARWPGPVVVEIPGLGPLTGDELRMFPDQPPLPGGLATIESYSGFSLTGTDVAALVILGELGVPIPPCPWDCDGSGDAAVNVLDLLALLSQYDSSPPCTGGSCDFNLDGCVNVLDLLKLLAHYDTTGTGCP